MDQNHVQPNPVNYTHRHSRTTLIKFTNRNTSTLKTSHKYKLTQISLHPKQTLNINTPTWLSHKLKTQIHPMVLFIQTINKHLIHMHFSFVYNYLKHIHVFQPKNWQASFKLQKNNQNTVWRNLLHILLRVPLPI